MSFEATRLTEELSADFTFVRLLACMDAHVLLEITTFTEGLSANTTYVIDWCMGDHVPIEVTLMTESLSAYVALAHIAGYIHRFLS